MTNDQLGKPADAFGWANIANTPTDSSSATGQPADNSFFSRLNALRNAQENKANPYKELSPFEQQQPQHLGDNQQPILRQQPFQQPTQPTPPPVSAFHFNIG